ncbi:SUKH-4 family immunity protein [Streptomyces sp. NPDC087903]|uniref:SUKH-4 family immunity protein n=1 Tax=Streptomyces sp. NPDC087903 TaxID=3365819 RepID=UPI00381EC2A6
MVTFAQAQERAEEWINGDVPSYQHREVRVREFGLGFVVWAEDRAEGPRSDGGAQRLVLARDSGEATLWPALPVGEVIRRYEEEYGRPDPADEPAPASSARVDLNQTSFLLSPPEWLQEAADKLGIPDRRGDGPGASPAGDSLPQTQAGVPAAAAGSGAPSGAAPWAGTDTNGDAGEDRSVPLPATVFAPPLSGDDETPPPAGLADAKTALISGGSQLPPTAVAPAFDPNGPGAQGSGAGQGHGPGGRRGPGGPGVAGAPGAPGVPGVPGGGPLPPSPPAGASSYGYPQGAGAAAAPGAPFPGGPQGAPSPSDASYGYPQGPGTSSPPPPPPGGPQGPNASSPPPPPGYPQGSGAGSPPPPPGQAGPQGAPSPSSYGYPQGPGASSPPPPPGYPQGSGAGSPPPPPGQAGPQGAPSPSSYGYPQGPNASSPPPPPGGPQGPGTSSPPPLPPGGPRGSGASSLPGGPGAPGRSLSPDAGDIADAATSKAAPQPRRARGAGAVPPPPGAPGAPGARPGNVPPPTGPGAPGTPAVGYVPTQLVSALGPDGPATPAGPTGAPAPDAPRAPGAPNPPGGTPSGDVDHAATVFADPGRTGAPPPPSAPGMPGAPRAPQPPGAPGAPQSPGPQGSAGGAQGAVHHAETVLAAPPVVGPGAPPPPHAPGAPGAPGGPQPMAPGAGAMPPPGQPLPGQPGPGQQPPAYGYPQGQPTVGPGYQAVLRFRAQDGSEQQLIRRSAPGTPHPEWQIFHELRAMNVPPNQVLELHTELESCELPGAYCARMIREQWPQARLASIAPYGTDHASRQQGMRQLLAHQGELHQVADGPARSAPVRAPLPQVQSAPPIPPEGVAQEVAGAFGPGVFRFEQAAVSRQGVPPVVAHSLVVAGLPMDMGPFFWAQAQPGRPVPTLAELAQERGVQPAPDAGSYLVMGSDFGRALCVQYGTANIVAVPVEAGPGGAPVPPQFVNTGLPEFQRCLALLGRMWRLRFGLNQEQAGRWTVDFQAQLVSLDPAALGSPESWWSVLLEQMWDGLL